MKKSAVVIIVVFIFVLTSLFASCSTTTTNQSPSKTTTETVNTTPVQTSVTTSATANWWDSIGTPQYGGTVTLRTGGIDPNFDPNDPRGLIQYEFDGLFYYDWSVDPNIHPYQSEFVEPEYHTGILAESWKQTDPLTITVYLREGVKWQEGAGKRS